MSDHPKVFISYAWESDEVKIWVRDLATRLRSIGIDVKLDQWEVVPGDQMPHYMERSVRENDYVLLICSPKYKLKSEKRIGGVGYEGDIMTAEVLQTSNHRKFIPALQSGSASTSIPSWLAGKYFIDLSNEAHFDKNFEDLTTTILNVRESAPALGKIPERFKAKEPVRIAAKTKNTEEEMYEIRIKGILVNEVTSPSNDGTRGSALYKIPFELNKRPDSIWIELFTHAWDRPMSFTSMHRPGISSVRGNKIYLDGTTIEEVERYHKDTLKLAVETANKGHNEFMEKKKHREEQEQRIKDDHKRNIDDISKRINFD